MLVEQGFQGFFVISAGGEAQADDARLGQVGEFQLRRQLLFKSFQQVGEPAFGNVGALKHAVQNGVLIIFVCLQARHDLIFD